MVIRDLGLEQAKAVTSPGTKEDQALGSTPELGLSIDDQGEAAEQIASSLLDAADAKLFRSVVARCNYLAQDRVDIQYACKECS